MRSPAGFVERAGAPQRVLAIDFGGLGDHIHSLPALWTLRRQWPQAQLRVLGGGELFGPLVPWIDAALPYARAGLRGDLRYIRGLRAQRFDVAVVITASNTAIALGGFSGARLRLARHADENKRWKWQDFVLSDVVDVPFHAQPMYRQRLDFLRVAGFAIPPIGTLADVLTAVDAAPRRALGIAAADDRAYLHLSASATDDRRDLPSAQMIELWSSLQRALPDLRFVVTSNATPRGRAKLDALLAGLPFAPWQVFSGNLDTPAFASVMQGAALHVGPDSGGLHVARLVGTPSVSWFRPNHHLRNWLPDEAGHAAFTAPESREDGLYGLKMTDLVEAACGLLKRAATPPTPAPNPGDGPSPATPSARRVP